jgi:hypothetical protein
MSLADIGKAANRGLRMKKTTKYLPASVCHRRRKDG